MSQPHSLCKTLVVGAVCLATAAESEAPRALVLDALQRRAPLPILNARDSVPAEFPKFEHLPRPTTGPAARAS
jgi:hypothetical protein